MTETEHTPGPWEITRVPIESRGGSNTCWKIGPFVACIYDDWRQREQGYLEAEIAANARLIAAAPELLEAAKQILASHGGEVTNLLRALDAAVAKAEGRDDK